MAFELFYGPTQSLRTSMAMNKILSRVGSHKHQQGQAEATPWNKTQGHGHISWE
jgi:hypothetical protein